MKRWALLGLAIIADLAGTLALRASQEHTWWLIVVVIGYVSAFVGLTLVVRAGLAIGVAYGIWGAVATAGTAALAAALFGEPLTFAIVAGIVMIIAGVLFVQLGSQSTEEQSS